MAGVAPEVVVELYLKLGEVGAGAEFLKTLVELVGVVEHLMMIFRLSNNCCIKKNEAMA